MFAHPKKWVAAGMAVAVALAALPSAALAADDEPDLHDVVSTPAARVEERDYGLAVIPIKTSEDEQQLYVWSAYYGSSYLLVGLARDDLYTLASTPVNTTITFAAEGSQGQVTLTNLGGGHFSGTYSDLAFGFYRDDLSEVAVGDGWAQALAQARGPALQSLGRTQEATIAQAILAKLAR